MTSRIASLVLCLITLQVFAQKGKEIKDPSGFNVGDFYNLIHKDTANHISAIKTKYFLSSDYFVDGPRKSLCSNRAIYPPITLTNKNITADFCLTENKKVYAIELNFTNVNYISDAILIEQLKTHKFEKGSFYRIDDYINSEYIRKEDSLYIETKWKDDKIFAIKFK